VAKPGNRIKLPYILRTVNGKIVFFQAVLDTVFHTVFIAQDFLKRNNTIKEVEQKRDILKVYLIPELEFLMTTF